MAEPVNQFGRPVPPKKPIVNELPKVGGDPKGEATKEAMGAMVTVLVLAFMLNLAFFTLFFLWSLLMVFF